MFADDTTPHTHPLPSYHPPQAAATLCYVVTLSFFLSSVAPGVGSAWNAWTCANAARGGHLDVLRWARENGCAWNANTCAFAAEGGHLEVLRWARENGCEWDARTATYAARGGHLDVLRWARENGYELGPAAIRLLSGCFGDYRT